MTDLFAAEGAFEPIPLDGADVSYMRHFDMGQPPEAMLDELVRTVPWRHEDITLWGKTYKQPRLIAWFGDAGTSYRYSGLSLTPLPWTPLLQRIRDRVQRATGCGFNSVLLNYYRDGSDSMGFHADDEKELGARPVIASVSLGAERALVFKSRHDTSNGPVRVMLGSGSLLLMKGDTQRSYKHGIVKQRRPIGARINLTFRTIIDPASGSG